jgi:WhiB family transcriptional regulator, redox-sensing transcriptional regulator
MTVTATVYDADWQEAGACRDMDPDLFFPISPTRLAADQIGKAKSICASCQVREECLQFALRTKDTHGIWGGTTPDERRRELRRRAKTARRLRPPS